MGEALEFTPKMDFPALAVEKIASELKEFKGDNKATAVSKFVASTLTHFCEENDRFAEVVYKTKRTLSDCCAEIMKGCGSSISDIDVYRGAVRSYFPNADIDFHMTITINGDAPSEEEMNRRPEVKAAGKVRAPKKPVEKKPTPTKPKVAAPEKPKQEKAKKPETIQLSLF